MSADAPLGGPASVDEPPADVDEPLVGEPLADEDAPLADAPLGGLAVAIRASRPDRPSRSRVLDENHTCTSRGRAIRCSTSNNGDLPRRIEQFP